MARYVEGLDRRQSFLLLESIQDYVGEDNPVRVIDVFVDRIDLSELGFGGALLAAARHPCPHTFSPNLGGRRQLPRFRQLLR